MSFRARHQFIQEGSLAPVLVPGSLVNHPGDAQMSSGSLAAGDLLADGAHVLRVAARKGQDTWWQCDCGLLILGSRDGRDACPRVRLDADYRFDLARMQRVSEWERHEMQEALRQPARRSAVR